MQHTVLFAEDNDELRMAVADQLAAAGFTVTTAADGQEAMELLDQSAYDIALLDIRMPGKDGLEVLRHLKSTRPAARAIMLTGVDDFSVAIQSVKLGANDYITKPFALEDLMACIKKVLQR
jgi:DNA-binding response OmpR family regulator